MNFASHIDHEEVNALPLRSFEGAIQVVDYKSKGKSNKRIYVRLPE